MRKGSLVYLIVSIILALLIIFSPVIITGDFSSMERALGPKLVSEFIMRTSALIIGLLVIYDAIKNYSE